VRESAEAIQDHLMPQREIELERLTEHREQRDHTLLIAFIRRVLERHVEEKR